MPITIRPTGDTNEANWLTFPDDTTPFDLPGIAEGAYEIRGESAWGPVSGAVTAATANLIPFMDPNAPGWTATSQVAPQANGDLRLNYGLGRPRIDLPADALSPNTNYITTFEYQTAVPNRSIGIGISDAASDFSYSYQDTGSTVNAFQSVSVTFTTPSVTTGRLIRFDHASSSANPERFSTLRSAVTVPA